MAARTPPKSDDTGTLITIGVLGAGAFMLWNMTKSGQKAGAPPISTSPPPVTTSPPPPSTTTNCPYGMTLVAGVCQPITPVVTGTGTVTNTGTSPLSPPPSSIVITCPPGQVFGNGICQTPTDPTGSKPILEPTTSLSNLPGLLSTPPLSPDILGYDTASIPMDNGGNAPVDIGKVNNSLINNSASYGSPVVVNNPMTAAPLVISSTPLSDMISGNTPTNMVQGPISNGVTNDPLGAASIAANKLALVSPGLATQDNVNEVVTDLYSWMKGTNSDPSQMTPALINRITDASVTSLLHTPVPADNIQNVLTGIISTVSTASGMSKQLLSDATTLALSNSNPVYTTPATMIAATQQAAQSLRDIGSG